MGRKDDELLDAFGKGAVSFAEGDVVFDQSHNAREGLLRGRVAAVGREGDFLEVHSEVESKVRGFLGHLVLSSVSWQ